MTRGSEASSTWSGLKKGLDELKWDYQRFEDKLTKGIPDVNFHTPQQGDVWVEMKFMDKVPANPKAITQIGLRREQYIWLYNGHRAGRRCHVLAKVGRSWFLWSEPGSWLLCRDGAPWHTLIAKALVFSDAHAVLCHLAS